MTFEKPVLTDRIEAGERLAEELARLDYDYQRGSLVLALPRGGVPVGFAIAQKLNIPLDVLPVRKVGAPGQPELALGAVTLDGIHYINQELVRQFGIPEESLELSIQEEEEQINRQAGLFRADQPNLEVRDRTVILTDDGLATGATMRAALAYLREQEPEKVIVAVPVAAKETLDEFKDLGVETVCLATPEPFYGVGMHYADFAQVADDEVLNYLEQTAPDITEEMA